MGSQRSRAAARLAALRAIRSVPPPSEKTPDVLLVYKNSFRPFDATGIAIGELADALNRSGITTQVLGLPQDYRAPATGGTRLTQRLGVFGRRLVDHLRQTAFLVEVTRHLRSMPDEHQVVITVDYPTGIGIVGPAARRLGRAHLDSVAWIMDNYQEQKLAMSRHAYDAHLRLALDTWSLRNVDRLVTIGECMAQRVERRIGRRPDVIPIWTHTHEPAREDDDAPRLAAFRRERWGISQSRLVVIYSGHAAAHHPLQALVDAALRVDGEGIHFVMAGVGIEMDRVRGIAALSTLGYWHFVPRVPAEELALQMMSADVHIVSLDPAVTGTCVPSKTYAAMTHGRPVIFIGDKDCQAAKDVISAGAGFVVAAGDAAELTRVLRELAAAPDTLRDMKERARTWAHVHRTSQVVTNEWEHYLRDTFFGPRPNSASVSVEEPAGEPEVVA